ncbi:MAG: ATP-binding protein, partial [Pseudomonadota bacterium]|nr:ATP-binding protein [Pseudomonadota bacterium]
MENLGAFGLDDSLSLRDWTEPACGAPSGGAGTLDALPPLQPLGTASGFPVEPADVLLPELRALPLIGRAEELRALIDWLDGPAPVAARCLVGVPGIGKTRLAIELGEHAAARGWVVGLASTEAAAGRARDATTLAPWLRPTLVVIEDFGCHGAALGNWVAGLARLGASARRPLRLLLLERDPAAAYSMCAGHAQLGPLEELAGLSQDADRRRLLEAVARVAVPRSVAPLPGIMALASLPGEPMHLIMAG